MDKPCLCGGDHFSSNHECVVCEKTGYTHRDEDCPKSCLCGVKYHTLDNHECSFCRERGHLEKDCNLNTLQHHVCNFCKRKGHLEKDCFLN